MIFVGKSKYITIVGLLVDMSILIISFILSYLICYNSLTISNEYYWPLVIFEFVWLGVSLNFNLCEVPRIVYIEKVIYKNIKAIFIFLFLSLSLLFFSSNTILTKKFVIIYILIFTFFLIVWKIFFINFVKRYRSKGYNFKKVVLIGFNENAEKIIDKIILNPGFGFKIMALFTDANLVSHSSLFYKGKLNDALEFCKSNDIDKLIISLPSYRSEFINKLIVYGENNLIRISIVPEFSEYLSQMFAMDYFDGIPVLKVRKEPLENLANKIMKRIFDIVFSWFVVLFILSWLFPIIALAIKLTSKGPVLFTQMRSGKDDVPFKCYKFRSMCINGDSDTVQATKNDPRITSVGSFLRRTSLDELPQFFNVIQRKMSVVGPRPHMVQQTQDYKRIINKFMVRQYTKPGITGWAQIKGFRGETKIVEDMKNRAEADIWYIENWNLLLDIKIILVTVWQMFLKKNDLAC